MGTDLLRSNAMKSRRKVSRTSHPRHASESRRRLSDVRLVGGSSTPRRIDQSHASGNSQAAGTSQLVANSASSGTGSVSMWIRELQEVADQRAANQLYRRYFSRLVTKLRARINRQVNAINDSEDAAQYVMAEVLRKLEKGKYPNLTDRESLWNLMLDIGDKRARKVWRYATAKRRDVRRQVDPVANAIDGDTQPLYFDPEGPGVTPGMEVEIQDIIQYLFDHMCDKEHSDLLVWELEGYAPGEIKSKLEEKLGRKITPRTFRRWRAEMKASLQSKFDE
ncbi:MAG: ECF-type sigma factor [Planctomycetota bacterium]